MLREYKIQSTNGLLDEPQIKSTINRIYNFESALAGQAVSRASSEAVWLGLEHVIHNLDAQSIALVTNLHRDLAGTLVTSAAFGELVRLDLDPKLASSKTVKLLTQLDATLREALQVVRELTEAQFPSVLKVFGLNAALQQHLPNLRGQFSGPVTLETNGEEPVLPLTSRLHLFRIVQSLMSLCMRYSGASKIAITSHSQKNRIEVAIDHDGSDEIWTFPEVAGELAVVKARCAAAECEIYLCEARQMGGVRIGVIAYAPTDSLTSVL